MKPDFPWGHSRRFNSNKEYLNRYFGGRVQKLAIDAGFTCPNRNGKVGTGGCTYCDNNSFNPSYCSPEKSISQQIQEGIEFHRKRYRRASRYIAYFQAYSNTYADIDTLRTLYGEALAYPEVIGLVIGTRPDCVDDEILDFLAELSEKVFLTIEYGIESCYDKTLKRINRGHDFANTLWALEESRERNIRTGGHFIIGLPGESRKEILGQAEIISSLSLHNIKFHQLQIIKDTAMAKEFETCPENFIVFELDDYLLLMKEFIERLNPEIVVDRIAGEVPPKYHINTSWTLRYDEVLRRFEKVLEEHDTWQGKLFKSTK